MSRTADQAQPPLARLFAIAYRQLITDLHAELARRGWTDVRPAYGFALLALREGPLSSGELGVLMGMTKQAASKLVEALVDAGLVLDRPDWVAAGREAAELLWRLHWTGDRLRRTSRGGEVGTAPGILEDYAATAAAATRLAAALADPVWLDRARTLLAVVLDVFDDAGAGFFDTAADAEQLYARPQDPTDNATPSGLSATVHALHLFAELTGEDDWAERAERAASTAGGLVRQAPRFAGWLLADAVSRIRSSPVQVAVVGEPGEQRDALVRTACRAAPAGSVVVAGRGDDPGMALLADRAAVDGQPTAYVCRHFVCRLPVTSEDALVAQLRG